MIADDLYQEIDAKRLIPMYWHVNEKDAHKTYDVSFKLGLIIKN